MPSAATPSPRRATRTSLGVRLRARAGEEAGFSLIEVLASAVIVILLSVAVAQGLIAGAHLSGYQQHKSQADEIAQQDQERLRGLSAKQLGNLATPESYPVSAGGTTFTVTSQASLLSTSGSTSCTTAGSGAVAYYHTVTTVKWSSVSGTQSVTEDSIITPPISGALLVKALDQTGAALPGVTVTATGQSGSDTESGTTDSNGCVIETGLAADTYNLALSDTGYVTYNGASSLTDSATVTDSGTATPTSAPEVLGQAGSMSATFWTNETSGPVSGQVVTDADTYGAGGTASMATFDTMTAGSGNTTFTASNLFPFYFSGPPGSYTSNYRVWAGKCLQEEPPSAYDTATVLPGGAATPTVQEPALNLLVSYNNGTTTSRVAPNDVKILFSSSSGTACSDTWVEAISPTAATSATGALASPGVPYASSSTTGATASASGQTGTLSACADVKISGSTYHSTTVQLPSGMSFSSPTTQALTVYKTNPTSPPAGTTYGTSAC